MDPQPRRIGPYLLLEPLGRGGMGVVYRAVHDDGRVVALKTVRLTDEGQLAGLRREIHALARLNHPGIVRILDEGVSDARPWYAMELLEGVTLRRFAQEVGWRSARPHLAPASNATSSGAEDAGLEWWTWTLEGIDVAQSRPAHVEAASRKDAGRGHPGLHEEEKAASNGPLPEKLSRLLRLARHLCGTLSYLHGEGVVHRDLKSGNVLVRTDGMPVLVDFGLATHFNGDVSREALTAAGFAAGTVSGMAPEQIRGELVDARADLYALGCLLYELSTGRPPFVGELPVEVLWQHLHSEPEPPSKFVPELPEAVDALILRLLAKDRRQRIGHADDVAAALGRMGVKGESSAGIVEHVEGSKSRVCLYRPGLVGREQLLSELESHLDRLLKGQGGLVLLGGESGIGKTRLLLELARQAETRRIRVVIGDCLRVDASTKSVVADAAPLQPLRRTLLTIADECRKGGVERTEHLLGRRGRVLAQYEPAFLGLPGQELHAEPARVSATAAKQRLFSALSETLLALAENEPLLLVLDDLQWADELTIGLLDFLARAASTRAGRTLGPLILATYRSDEISDALHALLDVPAVRRLHLGRLEEASVGQMVCDMLALEESPSVFARYLTRQSEGNPFFVAEYLRTAVREGLLWRDDAGRWHVAEAGEEAAAAEGYERLPLPQSIWELVARRLERLGDAAARLVEGAAVLGKEVDGSLLARVSALGAIETLEGTLELIRQQVMEDSGLGGLRFVHDKLREVAYRQIAPERLLKLHRAAAEALEAPGPPERQNFATIGHHWEHAGVPEKARSWYLKAADKSRERFANADAERLYRAYLRLADGPTPASPRVRYELGFTLFRYQARHAEAIAELQLAEQEAQILQDRHEEARSLWSRGGVHREIGQADIAEQLMERALVIVRELGDKKQESVILGNLGGSRGDGGHFSEGRELLERALKIQIELGEGRLQGATLLNLSSLCAAEGSTEVARRYVEAALPLLRAAGDRQLEGAALERLAAISRDEGRPLEEIQALLEQALAAHREVGDRRMEVRSVAMQLSFEAQAKGVEESRELFERALGAAREIGYVRLEGMILWELAEHIRRTGDPAEALHPLERAVELLAQVKALNYVGYCFCERGHLALAQRESARKFLDDAREMARELKLDNRAGLPRAIDRLQRAIDAFEAGEVERLFRGELVQEMPRHVRNGLVRTGQLASC